jgi:hypothetical protein
LGFFIFFRIVERRVRGKKEKKFVMGCADGVYMFVWGYIAWLGDHELSWDHQNVNEPSS